MGEGSDRLEQLKEVLELKSFPMGRNPISYAWSKAAAADILLKADYDAVGKQQKAQQAFRLECAKKEYNRLVAQQKVKKDTYEEIDQSIGEYITIAQIFDIEGGNSSNQTIRRDGIQATANYIRFCLEKSHFCAWNEGTQRCDFLRLTRRWYKNWKQDWTLKTVIEVTEAEKQIDNNAKSVVNPETPSAAVAAVTPKAAPPHPVWHRKAKPRLRRKPPR